MTARDAAGNQTVVTAVVTSGVPLGTVHAELAVRRGYTRVDARLGLLVPGHAERWLDDPVPLRASVGTEARRGYCSTLAPAMPTGMAEPSLLKKIVPRESVPNDR